MQNKQICYSKLKLGKKIEMHLVHVVQDENISIVVVDTEIKSARGNV